jgi:hypothetical protein
MTEIVIDEHLKTVDRVRVFDRNGWLAFDFQGNIYPCYMCLEKQDERGMAMMHYCADDGIVTDVTISTSTSVFHHHSSWISYRKWWKDWKEGNKLVLSKMCRVLHVLEDGWPMVDGWRSSVCNPKHCRRRTSPHPSAVKSSHPSGPRDLHKLQTDGTTEDDGWFFKKVLTP